MDGRPPCVNDDIAIQWQWSNFDPSQNPNPFTDYDKTLHNWLRPRDERATQNLCQSAVRVRLGKYVKYNTKIFFPDSPTEVTLGRIFTHNDSNYAQSRKEVPFWGLHDGRQHFGVQIPQKPSKMAFYKHVRASANGLKTNDVIEDRRHWLAVAQSRPSSVGPILFIASGQNTAAVYLKKVILLYHCTSSYVNVQQYSKITFLFLLFSMCEGLSPLTCV